MENNLSCIFITKKEYDELRVKAKNNTPEIKVSLYFYEGSFQPSLTIMTSTSFTASSRLNTFISKTSEAWKKKVIDQIDTYISDRAEVLAEEKVKNLKIAMEKQYLEDTLKKHGFLSWLFKMFA